MKSHTVSYEQFCFVLGRNVIFEETHYRDGRMIIRCANGMLCAKDGGCKNTLLRDRAPELET